MTTAIILRANKPEPSSKPGRGGRNITTADIISTTGPQLMLRLVFLETFMTVAADLWRNVWQPCVCLCRDFVDYVIV